MNEGILFTIGADVTRIQSDMAKVSSVMGSSVSKMEGMFNRLKGSLAGIISVGALAFLAKDAINTADRVEEMGRTFGIAASELSTYMVTAKQSGIETEGVGKGLKFLAKNAVDAAAGGEKTAGTFRAMGIDVRDASGQVKPLSVLMDEVRGKFSTYEDGAEKAALATKLFGKEGQAMVPWLSQSVEQIERVNKVARDFGKIMSDEAIGVTAELADNLDLLQFAAEGMANQFVAGIAPALNQVSTELVAWATETNACKVAADALVEAVKVLVGAGYTAVLMFRMLGTSLAGFAAAAVAFFSGEMGQIGGIWSATMEQLDSDMGKYGDSMSKLTGENTNPAGFVGPVRPKVMTKAPVVGEGAEGDYEKIRKKIEELNGASLSGLSKEFASLDAKVSSFASQIQNSKTMTGAQQAELRALAEATAEAAKQTAFSASIDKLKASELSGMAKHYHDIDKQVKDFTAAVQGNTRYTAEQRGEMIRLAEVAGEVAKDTYSAAAALKLQNDQLEAETKHLKETTDAMIAGREAAEAFFKSDASGLTNALDALSKQAESAIQSLIRAYDIDAETPPPQEFIEAHAAIISKLEKRKTLLLELGGIEAKQARERAEYYAASGIAIDAEAEAMNAQREAIFDVAVRYGDVTVAISMLNEGMLAHQQRIEDTQAYVSAFVDVWKEAYKSIGRMALDVGMDIREGLVGALSDTILGAKTASEAFSALGKAVLKMIVDTLLKWIVNRTIMAGLEAMFIAGTVETTTFAAAAIGAAWITPAYLASVATLGSADVDALAALALGIAGAQGLLLASKGVQAGLGGGLSDAIGGGTGAMFASGSDFVPKTMTALVHMGERILTPEQNKDFTQFIKGEVPGSNAGGDVYLDGHLVGRILERRAERYGGMKLRFT